MMSEGQVYIVDDDRAVRESLQWLLESIGLRVSSHVSADEFLQQDVNYPACLILDVRMPGMSGLDLLDILVKKHPELPVIIVTGHADVPMAIRAMKNGAYEFIEKPYNDQRLIDCVNDALKLSIEKLDNIDIRNQIQQRFELLTAREKEILDQVVDGQSNKLMARNMDVSIKTIEAHRAKVMEKTQAHSLAELLRMYYLLNHKD